MKKSCILLFVMSIISLLLSIYAAISYMNSTIHLSEFSVVERTVENSLALDLGQVAVEVAMFFDIVLFVPSLILGVSGLVSSIIKGRLSLLCIILDSLPLAYIFCATISYLIDKDNLYKDYMPILLFLALYMAGAVAAFKGRKKTAKIS